jgi:hypothetical protein
MGYIGNFYWLFQGVRYESEFPKTEIFYFLLTRVLLIPKKQVT